MHVQWTLATQLLQLHVMWAYRPTQVADPRYATGVAVSLEFALSTLGKNVDNIKGDCTISKGQ